MNACASRYCGCAGRAAESTCSASTCAGGRRRGRRHLAGPRQPGRPARHHLPGTSPSRTPYDRGSPMHGGMLTGATDGGPRPGHPERHRTTRPSPCHPLAAPATAGLAAPRSPPRRRSSSAWAWRWAWLAGGGSPSRPGFDPHRVDSTVGPAPSRNGPSSTPAQWTTRSTCTSGRCKFCPSRAPDLGRTWRNVVSVPARSTTIVRIAFDAYTGRTVYHCHILDHEDNGMMGVIQVSRATDPGWPAPGRSGRRRVRCGLVGREHGGWRSRGLATVTTA